MLTGSGDKAGGDAVLSEQRYYQSLDDGRRIYDRGQTVVSVVDHPTLGTAIRHGATDYRLAEDPRWRDEVVVDGPDGPYSRYFVKPTSAADLKRRRDLIALASELGGTIPPLIHEIGTDALFGLMMALGQADPETRSRYLPRVEAFWRTAAREDWALAVSQTDPKGDRSRRPADQVYPESYLRIVAREERGIRISGTKVHTSVAVNAHWLIVLPTRAMRAEDGAFAVACAVPVNAPGLSLHTSPYLGGPHNPWERPVAARHRMVESVVRFEDVFVPWDQVFLAGEHGLAGPVARAFVEFHRFTAVSYKLPLLSALTGVASLLADYNGVRRAPHVQQALGDLALYETTVRALLDNAADRGSLVDPGLFRPHPMIVNLAKHFFATGLHQAMFQVQNIAGGLLVTAPAAEAWEQTGTADWLDRAFSGHEVGGRERLRVMHLAADLTASDLATYHQVLAVHAEGSIQAERMTALEGYDWSAARALAERLAGAG
jgi:4-hydroxybutyryl-CoA dehydratase/vinylacetyl-CoA-Delta-isomerase